MPNEYDDRYEHSRVREAQMQLFNEVGNQLGRLTDAVQGLAAETREVRERMARLEAGNQPERISKLENIIGDLYTRLNNSEKEHAAALTVLKEKHGDDKLALEKRLSRMEVIIAPLTVLGSSGLSAIIGASVTFLLRASAG